MTQQRADMNGAGVYELIDRRAGPQLPFSRKWARHTRAKAGICGVRINETATSRHDFRSLLNYVG